MAINFPATPTLNQTYTFNGRTWTYNGVGWQATGASGLSVYTKTDFTATAAQTTFTVAYTVGFVDVYYNGSKLSITEYTATNGTSVVLGTACALNDIVETVAWTVSTTLNPALGVATATSLAIGGATIGSNALAVTGSSLFPGSTTITAAGLVGIGMTPVNILDITQSVNGQSLGSILNSNAGVNANAKWFATNGTNWGTVGVLGQSFTTTGAYVAGYGFAAGNTGMSIIAQGGPILFASNGTAEVARFDTSGRLCVNTTSTIFSERQRISFNGTSVQGLLVDDSSNTNGSNYVIFYTNGAQRGGITNNSGTGVLFNVTSDERLKTWRTDQRDFRSMILGVDVGDVEWKSVPGSRTLAVMAQQTNEFYPDAITPGKTDADMWQADYSRLAPLALWGVKDLYKTIQELTTRLAALESK